MQVILPMIGLVAIHVGQEIPVILTVQPGFNLGSQFQRLPNIPLRQYAGMHHQVIAFGICHALVAQPLH